MLQLDWSHGLDMAKDQIFRIGAGWSPARAYMWQEVFCQKYFRPDGKGSIGLAGEEYKRPNMFAVISEKNRMWDSHLVYSDNVFNKDWRWLVVREKL